MAHTADIFLVDAQGMLRARFPFGTAAEPMIEAVRALLAETPPQAAASAPPDPRLAPPRRRRPRPPSTPRPGRSAARGARRRPRRPRRHGRGALYPEIVSTSIWAEPGDPVILRVVDGDGAKLDDSVPLSVQLAQFDGTPVGSPVTASAVLPEGATAALLRGADGHPLAGRLEAEGDGRPGRRATSRSRRWTRATRCPSVGPRRTSTRPRWTMSVVWCAP